MTRIRLLSGTRVRMVLQMALVTVLLLTSLAAFDAPVSAQSATWRGEYYGNTTLSGSPALVRNDSSINFDWGTGSPATGVPADRFSVRWTTFAHFDAGTYTFTARVDDGVRLWVDDELLIDQWRDQSATTFTATKALGAGYHSVRVEYYENSGQALCAISWTTGTAITDWRGEYYNNTSLTGSPVLVRNDTAVDLSWGMGSPAPGVHADRFSARWTRDVHFPTTGEYVFTVTSDDGVRVWVDGRLILDAWFDQSATTYGTTVQVTAGTRPVRIEYYDALGEARISVSWALRSATPVTHEVIVDELDSGFLRGGPAGGFYGRWIGHKGHMYWTWNSATKQYNWAKWFPILPSAGNWEVLVYIPSRYAGTRSAKYSVFHNGGRTDVVVNQSVYSDEWVSLGTYAFMGGQGPQSGRDYVFLNDVTGEPYTSISVGIDAVKFVKRDGTAPVTPPSTTCSITPVLGFGRVWSGISAVRAKLGCANEVEKSVWMGEQAFQGGVMYWRQDAKDIYVLYNNGTWQTFQDTWQQGETEWDVSIVAPGGLFQPKRGFGRVWRENQGVRDTLGWATMEERGFQGSIQPFHNGRMLWSNVRGVFILYNDGTWQRVN